MKTAIGIITFLFLSFQISAQQQCGTAHYENQEFLAFPSLMQKKPDIEAFAIQPQVAASLNNNFRTAYSSIIKIPVVVHVLYHHAEENVTIQQIQSQIDVLNRDFRKNNADTANIPAGFKSFAADCEIEFKLATIDFGGRATSGVVRKYTPVTEWTMDDKIKFSSAMGDDAWDANSYLNIWIGNIRGLKGYSTFPGAPAEKDGIVLNLNVIGGRTLVHETGHWLGLKHIWGDADCGNDMVEDTPNQRGFTPGCPSSVRITCTNAPLGDMYMNYMDFTNDACLSMFTKGQKQRMRSLFVPGGARYSLLSSYAFGKPVFDEKLPGAAPQWLHVKIYPNPTTSDITINLEYDARWIGKEIIIVNMNGQMELKTMISATLQKINVSKLKRGMYFIKAEKENEKINQKFVKM